MMVSPSRTKLIMSSSCGRFTSFPKRFIKEYPVDLHTFELPVLVLVKGLTRTERRAAPSEGVGVSCRQAKRARIVSAGAPA